ncbi:Putative rhamnosyl transferase [Paracoccus aminovorans]|uniref:Putative rhamnosyl transferase n=1 Tax=Paracoccus aminovorans TaxID=34004 RepID=A0A1I3B7M9_9RHOB|nr:hypothetical protein JCM7685_0841 [Paracoccus aminovorans]SFH58303.1 Putative rhamnosyl transferase [Paracoccus aminovorans]
MQVVGICRFSLLGRGDWRPYRGKPDDEVGRIANEQAAKLFAPDRMERRLATFEHITLPSLKAQTDQNFIFLVAASELIPEEYKARLQKICDEVPQVVLRFFPLINVGKA